MAVSALTLPHPDWLVTRDAAALLGISERYVYYLTSTQKVRTLRVGDGYGSRLLILREDLIDYQQRHPRLGRRRRNP